MKKLNLINNVSENVEYSITGGTVTPDTLSDTVDTTITFDLPPKAGDAITLPYPEPRFFSASWTIDYDELAEEMEKDEWALCTGDISILDEEIKDQFTIEEATRILEKLVVGIEDHEKIPGSSELMLMTNWQTLRNIHSLLERVKKSK